MKVKQKSIRAFEFTIAGAEDEAELLEYIDQNRQILQSFLIVIEGEISEITRQTLETSALKIVTASGMLHAKERVKTETPVAPVSQPIPEKAEMPALESAGLINYMTPIRSGNELECDDDIAVFGRINSGAKVFAKKNAIIFSIIDGTVEAAGEYLILQNIGKGQVFFHGEEITAESLNGRLCKVTLKNGQLTYEEL